MIYGEIHLKESERTEAIHKLLLIVYKHSRKLLSMPIADYNNEMWQEIYIISDWIDELRTEGSIDENCKNYLKNSSFDFSQIKRNPRQLEIKF
jgi:hypothetical protein